MESNSYSVVHKNRTFIRLVRRRRTVVLSLTAATLIPYYAYILIAAYRPGLLAASLGAHTAMTAGWTAGIALIVGTWLLTGLYVHYANGEFDGLSRKIGAEVTR